MGFNVQDVEGSITIRVVRTTNNSTSEVGEYTVKGSCLDVSSPASRKTCSAKGSHADLP